MHFFIDGCVIDFPVVNENERHLEVEIGMPAKSMNEREPVQAIGLADTAADFNPVDCMTYFFLRDGDEHLNVADPGRKTSAERCFSLLCCNDSPFDTQGKGIDRFPLGKQGFDESAVAQFFGFTECKPRL